MLTLRRSGAARGLPSGSMSLVLAAPQGSSRTVIGPRTIDSSAKAIVAPGSTRPARSASVMSAIDFPERFTVAPELALGVEEINRCFDIGVEAVQREVTLPHLSMEPAPPAPVGATSGIEDDAADEPGIVDALAVRSEHLAAYGDAGAEGDLDILGVDAGFEFDSDVAMRVGPSAASQAVSSHAESENVEHVVLARAPDQEVTQTGLRCDLKRAVGSSTRRDERGLPFCARDKLDGCTWNRFAGSLLGDLAADRDATGQGDVEGLLERGLGPLEHARGDQIGLAGWRISCDSEGAVRRLRIDAEPPVGAGLVFGVVGDPPLARPDLERGSGDALAGVGVGDAPGDGLGWCQRCGE